MAKTYLIPHNYKDNGRIFNLFDKKRLRNALIWLIPATIGIFYLPFSFSDKIFCWVLIALPPTLAILAGYGDWIKYFLIFINNRRIYYNAKRSDADAFLYVRFKTQKEQSKANHNK